MLRVPSLEGRENVSHAASQDSAPKLITILKWHLFCWEPGEDVGGHGRMREEQTFTVYKKRTIAIGTNHKATNTTCLSYCESLILVYALVCSTTSNLCLSEVS